MTHDEDDDTQVYADTLLLVYQRGFADGKKAAQRKPLTDAEILRNEMWKWYVGLSDERKIELTRAIEAAHDIKEGA